MTAIVTAIETSCGTISRSKKQTGWAVERARRWIDRRHPGLEYLTDDDIVWLLVMGWAP